MVRGFGSSSSSPWRWGEAYGHGRGKFVGRKKGWITVSLHVTEAAYNTGSSGGAEQKEQDQIRSKWGA